MEIKYTVNSLTAQVLSNLRNRAGWGNTPVFQAEKALTNTLFSVTALDGDRVVGMGRLVGDGALIWYIQDVIVLPEYGKRGIGTVIMEHLLDHIKKNSLPDTVVSIGLMAAKGKEFFYEKFDFRIRPNHQEGAGMIFNKTIF